MSLYELGVLSLYSFSLRLHHPLLGSSTFIVFITFTTKQLFIHLLQADIISKYGDSHLELRQRMHSIRADQAGRESRKQVCDHRRRQQRHGLGPQPGVVDERGEHGPIDMPILAVDGHWLVESPAGFISSLGGGVGAHTAYPAFARASTVMRACYLALPFTPAMSSTASHLAGLVRSPVSGPTTLTACRWQDRGVRIGEVLAFRDVPTMAKFFALEAHRRPAIAHIVHLSVVYELWPDERRDFEKGSPARCMAFAAFRALRLAWQAPELPSLKSFEIVFPRNYYGWTVDSPGMWDLLYLRGMAAVSVPSLWRNVVSSGLRRALETRLRWTPSRKWKPTGHEMGVNGLEYTRQRRRREADPDWWKRLVKPSVRGGTLTPSDQHCWLGRKYGEMHDLSTRRERARRKK